MANKITILTVQEDEILRDGMRMILEAQGYDVKEAFTGSEAKKAVETRTFDLIVCDIKISDFGRIEASAPGEDNV